MSKTRGLEQHLAGLPLFARGKVRDIYDLGDSLLILVTDRISAFDVVFAEEVPQKGVVLNLLAAFWFNRTKDLVPNHMISVDPLTYPAGLADFARELAGRSMLVQKARMLPAEFIVRGYLEGSALKEYRQSQTAGGIFLPAGLVQAQRLPEPIFTPSTKADAGHDINITFAQLCELIGFAKADQVRRLSLALYAEAADYCAARGIILADTKFEFGEIDGEIVIADEMCTPDSSRFWEKSAYEPGRPQKSFDKQYLRDWLETLDWDKAPPPPALPAAVLAATASRYKEAYQRLTGQDLPELVKRGVYDKDKK